MSVLLLQFPHVLVRSLGVVDADFFKNFFQECLHHRNTGNFFDTAFIVNHTCSSQSFEYKTCKWLYAADNCNKENKKTALETISYQ